MRLLMAEDDRGLAELLERGLREHGYAVDVCAARAIGRSTRPR